MKRWVKGTLIGGAALVLGGIGISAVAAAAGGVSGGFHSLERLGNLDELDERLEYDFHRHLGGLTKRERVRVQDSNSCGNLENQLVDSEAGMENGAGDGNRAGAGSGAGAGNGTGASAEKMELFDTLDGITRLKVSAQLGNARVEERMDGGDEIAVYVSGEPELQVYIEQEEAGEAEITLSCRQSGDGTNGNGTQMVVQIPSGTALRELELETGNGVLEAGNLQAEYLEAEAEAGTISIEYFEAETASMGASAGKIVANGRINRGLEAEAERGNVILVLDGARDDYRIAAENHSGEILVDGEVWSGHHGAAQSSGNQKYMELECEAGKIIVNFSTEA